MDTSMQYISGGRVDLSGPLNRFLPPVPEGTARAYVAGLRPSSALILDPFAALPRLSVEMARAGQRVLVTAGNPVSSFLLDLAAHPPQLIDLQAALADLAAARKEGKRLETLLQSLYFTRCDQCQRELPAEAFLWDSKTGALTGRIYNCICGSGGEHPATPLDMENAVRWALTDGLHRSRALERVVPGDDPDRRFAEEALSFYAPRAVYAIGTIINAQSRLDGLPTSSERRRCLSALLLYAADCANALWPHLTERPRPRHLTFPPVYRENNVWMALEAAVKVWASADSYPGSSPRETPISVTFWPQKPPESGGLCIFEGRLRDLAPELEGIPIQAVVTTIPRPNQAFWTLSALWSGWLWGSAAVGHFKSVLRRRRYDWQWHAEALKALFGNLAQIIPPEAPVFGILAEPEAHFVSAVYLAAQAAGLDLSGLAMRTESEPIQFLWKRGLVGSGPEGLLGKSRASSLPAARKKKPLAPDVRYTRNVIREILAKSNEPMLYLHLHTAALAVLANKGMLQWNDEALSAMGKNMLAALASPEFIDLEGRATPESGRWALKKGDHQEILTGL
jgi:hypothetical protein